LLGQAGDLVAPGGRLIYATCSLLPQENTGALAAFLEGRPDYELLPIEGVWQEALAGAADCPAPPGAGSLTLTPARHGCDGFFIAVLQRRSAS
jgi:16S rRNA (cytosine967-C5)-methyltransferase